jgi:NADH-quinone oxidoreductase subunit C
MVGVYFAGHRRIQKLLTDYGLRGHPLRKDFPVVGYVECFFSYRTRGIEFVPVEFMQEYRKFEFYENWAAAGVAHEDSISGAGAAGPLDREIA